MLAFFRRLRHSTVGSNSFKRYLLYAIGEILLVMVGILLALQVNNWNESRKKRSVEKEILTEIKNDLEETLYDDLEEDLSSHMDMLWSTHLVKDALLNKAPYHDSLEYHILRCFDDTRTYYKNGGYQSLLSNGLDIISNDSLRIKITDLYQLGFTRLDESAVEYEHRKILRPYMSKHFILSSEISRTYYSEGFLPDTVYHNIPRLISYDSLCKDNPFILELDNSLHYRQRKIRRCFVVRNRIHEILEILEKEIIGN